MKTTLIAAATAVAAMTVASLAITSAASSARTGNKASILAAEGNTLFKARGTPWYISSQTNVTCIQETQVSYYCSNLLWKYFVGVSGGFATWNAFSESESNSNPASALPPAWMSTVVAITNAP